MSPRYAFGFFATLVFLWPLGSALGQVGEAGSTPPTIEPTNESILVSGLVEQVVLTPPKSLFTNESILVSGQTTETVRIPPKSFFSNEPAKGFGQIDGVTGTAGPVVAPVGSTIQIAIANDSAQVISLWCPHPFRITDTVGNVIHTPLSPPVLVDVNPGEVHRMVWRQTNDQGQQVPVGDYLVEFLCYGLDPVPITIDATVEMGLTMVGPPRLGRERTLFLTSPGDPNRIYIAAAALSADVGMQTCEGLFPLDRDWLLDFSIRPNNGVFLDFIGDLNGKGETLAPSIRLPETPTLVGLNWHLAFVSVEFGPWCPLKRISPAIEVLIQ